MQTVIRTATIQLNAPPHEIFPLFTPVGERLWIADWDPEYIYPDTGEAGTGTIFKTSQDTPNGPIDTIWVTVEYDTDLHKATYINVTPDVLVTRIEVACDAAINGTSTAQVTYTLTALSEKGYKRVAHTTEEHYQQEIAWWQKAINHYLAHSEPLPHG